MCALIKARISTVQEREEEIEKACARAHTHRWMDVAARDLVQIAGKDVGGSKNRSNVCDLDAVAAEETGQQSGTTVAMDVTQEDGREMAAEDTSDGGDGRRCVEHLCWSTEISTTTLRVYGHMG